MNISDDVCKLVLSYLPPADLVKVAQTCSRMRNCCRSLPLWTELRQELRIPSPQRRNKSDYTLVIRAACFKCRFQKKMPSLPICRFCMGSDFVLGRLRRKAQHIAAELSDTLHYQKKSLDYERRVSSLNDSLNETRLQFDAKLAKHQLVKKT